MKSKHTPGPWCYFVGNSTGRGLVRIEAEGRHIASMPRGEQSEADARLIAAAPELLTALKGLVDIYASDDAPKSSHVVNRGGSVEWQKLARERHIAALSAIAKAEDRS